MSLSKKFATSPPRANPITDHAPTPEQLNRLLDWKPNDPAYLRKPALESEAGRIRSRRTALGVATALQTGVSAFEFKATEPLDLEIIKDKMPDAAPCPAEPQCQEAAWRAYWPEHSDWHPQRHLWKRVLDITIILLLLPLLLPLMAAIVLFIKLVSPGPVLFRQRRTGFQGEEFECLKFRSMHHGADTEPHQDYYQNLMKSNRPMEKLDTNDKRLIPWGVAFRATGLDELPQVFNVLRGDMSLVGPRPCIPSEFENYLPWHKRRCEAMPGITGLWQVSGKNKLTFNEMIELDIEYARSQSIGKDLHIIVRTGPVLLGEIRQSFQRKFTLHFISSKQRRRSHE